MTKIYLGGLIMKYKKIFMFFMLSFTIFAPQLNSNVVPHKTCSLSLMFFKNNFSNFITMLKKYLNVNAVIKLAGGTIIVTRTIQKAIETTPKDGLSVIKNETTTDY